MANNIYTGVATILLVIISVIATAVMTVLDIKNRKHGEPDEIILDN